MLNNIGVFIPTYNAIRDLKYFDATLKILKQLPKSNFRILIIDSSSSDATVALVNLYEFEVVVISQQEFDHGRTRQYAADLLKDCQVIVYLTQDVKLDSVNSIYNIVDAFQDALVGCAFGRQLPHQNADIFATENRYYNYPDSSYERDYSSRFEYGIKTVFSSDSFAAYRVDRLNQIGGFPDSCIVSEDMFVVAKMIQAGCKLRYVADAVCYHSHNYTLKQEFSRYFDIGVFFAMESWIKRDFGNAEAEGKKSILLQLKRIKQKSCLSIPSFMLRICIRAISFKLGSNYAKLPLQVVKLFSGQRHYWDR